MVKRQNNRDWRSGYRVTGIRMLALIAALIGSAGLLAMAIRSPQYWWVAWIGLVPLFYAIRLNRPVTAALSGAIWGISFFLFSLAGTETIISPTLPTLTLLAITPAMYCGLGSLLTKRVGFNPLLLALGWIGVELSFKPLGLNNGLLAGTQAGSTHFHWIGRMLGYIFVAFLVACANATLLAILSNARLIIPLQRLCEGLPKSEAYPTPNTFLFHQLWNFQQGYPRAPPLSSMKRRFII